MADYSYMNRGSGTYGKGRLGPRVQAWDTTYNGVEESRDNWSKSGYVAKGEVYQDSMHRPVIVDDDNRMRPSVLVCPPYHSGDGFVTKTETIVEQVYRPTAYTNGPFTKVEPTKEYVVSNKGWGRTGGQLRDQTAKAEEFFSDVQTAASEPSRTGFLPGLFHRHNPNLSSNYGSSTNDSGTNGRSRSNGTTIRQPSYDVPLGRNDLVPDGPRKPMITTDGRNRASVTTIRQPNYDSSLRRYDSVPDGIHTPTTDGWNRASGTNLQQQNFDNSLGRNDLLLDDNRTPTLITTDGWTRPSRLGWKTPPESPLSGPTSDIGSVTDFVRESTKPSFAPPPRRFFASPPTLPAKETATVTIDSTEAARKYNGKFI
eukprot:TRINITY_DN9843_c0_g1_i1.p1 TRINITY_DN9843_c0_g1~~TRINITY_DN9843_c0_g1_i1.p1  ORF type:complete len:388 (-),score=43.98 TRINITY_DN9843_c0_g1_i1:144-1253(-)